jgi:uncharacterized protein
MTIWVDIINPSHAPFFNSVIKGLAGKDFYITVRDRAETVQLVKLFGIDGHVIGADHRDMVMKTVAIIDRSVRLFMAVKEFDCALSFENPMSVWVSKMKRKKSVLMCDNDLKFVQQKSAIQSIESRVKYLSDFTLVPLACKDSFSRQIGTEHLLTYDGYKEDVYIADYQPDPYFREKVPFDRFIVLRPEALASFYVVAQETIVPELVRLFAREGINIVYLPRDKGDTDYIAGSNVFIPKSALNGLDLCYHSDAVLTGSGTMAREAACMGKCAISFFPSETLLSVDRDLVSKEKMMHSRDPHEILNHFLSSDRAKSGANFERSRKVKRDVLDILDRIC